MIQKDIRNAGFRFEANAAITDPVKIYDTGDAVTVLKSFMTKQLIKE